MEDPIVTDLSAVAAIDAVPMILEVICRTTGLGFAAVARVTEERWVACAVRDEIAFGLAPGGELPIETTICDEIRASGQLVVIAHASQDQRFCRHPTPRRYGFESYISVPIVRPNGEFFGTLCAIDPQPARVDDSATVGMFKLFADLIAFHLDTQERLDMSEAELRDERHTAELREQFIAVLGHDLRTPLASIEGSAQVLRAMPLGEKAGHIAARIQRSAARMSGLIDNVLDFARGRLGGGLTLDLRSDGQLESVLEHGIAEMRSSWPHRAIRTVMDLRVPVPCDSARMAQLFSNLLANALTHGDPSGAVQVIARSNDREFELAVSNGGEPIPPEMLERLFEPFSRASAHPDRKGLGLGLYIAAEIARAHGGTLSVTSDAEETRFTFRVAVR